MQLFVANYVFKLSFTCIAFYSPSYLGQEIAKGSINLRVKPPPVHLSITHGGDFTLSILLLNVKKKSCEYQFSYSLHCLTQLGIESASAVSVADALSSRTLVSLLRLFVLS